MAQIFYKSRYLHVPRTGGKWFHKACKNGGLHQGFWWPKHSTLKQTGASSLYTFTVVRNPFSWYASYWGYKQQIGLWGSKFEPWTTFDWLCESDKFSDFIFKACDQQAGFYSHILESYTGPPNKEIDFVGRFESLKVDLTTALVRAGEKFNKKKLVATKPRNSVDYLHLNCSYSHKLATTLYESEKKAFERFGYEFFESWKQDSQSRLG